MSAPAKTSEFPIDARRDIPSAAGVYVFRDRHGAILYIGKSVSLKQRVASYFQSNPGRRDERIKRMVFSARTIFIHETGSELSALLLEDRLIKQHLPPYNKRQKEYLKNRYLLLGGGAYPFVAEADSPDGHDPEKLHGPFRDRYFVEKLIEVIRSAFGLRSCTEPAPSARCADHEVGRCAGPCREKVSHADYALIVGAVRQFVDGSEDEVVVRLTRAMDGCAARFDFEKAAAIRDRIAFSRNFCRRQRFVERFKTGFLVIREAEADRVHIFIRGAHQERTGRVDANGIENLTADAVRQGRQPAEDIRFITDRAHVVYTWLRKSPAARWRFVSRRREDSPAENARGAGDAESSEIPK